MEFARALYTVAGCAVLPWLPLRLWWRGRREPGYRRHIAERFGRYRGGTAGSVYWIHAVSVGETRAATPLVQRLRAAYPDATLLLTHMTASGREAGQTLFGDQVRQAWLPYDLPFAVRSFLAHFRPVAGLVLETELWPNLVAVARESGTPLFLVNARLSERSSRGYHRVECLARPMLGRLAGVAAQSAADAARLAELGAPQPIVTGNLKFDVTIPPSMLELGAGFRTRFGASRPVWVAASTRDGEEALLLDALAKRRLAGNPLLVIVPRHPQRFATVAELLSARGVPFVRRSAGGGPVPADTGVVLGDSMGEMAAYYAAADVAFVGGSLLPFGAHNLIEPLAMGTPVLVGPYTFNFAEATAGAIEAGAAVRVSDAEALIAAVSDLFADPGRRQAMGLAARAFHAQHQGASDRLWDWLQPQLAAHNGRRER
ncbi:MAG TPA: lipid IV(A) 3-deoxy-D-manno-octulosonic acid transferase [Casimicrobiaceae bacterium]|nr:lipid IV(A) 3-deoxy-D-manno-octulosonic acid transferase [Casimicrobiaceae bacterium]